MRPRLRRTAVVLGASVLGIAVLTPLAPVARAAGGTQVQLYVASKAGGAPALYSRATGARLSPSGAHVLELRASLDGSRFVDVEASLDGTGSQVQSIVVYDVSGNRVRVVTTVSSSASELRSPALSPDGSRVVWVRNDHAGPVHTLLSAPAAGGSATTLGSDLYSPVYLNATTLLVRHFDGTGHWMPASGGDPTPVPTLPWNAVGVTVSPNGGLLAWEDWKYAQPVPAGDIHVATVSTSGGVTVGTPYAIATGLDNFGPAFSRDGSQVEYVHNDGAGGPGAIYRAPAAGGSPPVPVDATSIGDVRAQAIGANAAPVALRQPSSSPAVLAGSVATLRWTDPGDARVSGVRVSRYRGTTLQRTVFVALPATSYRDSGLTVGTTYRYTFASVDRSGHVAPGPASRFLTAAAASPSFADPTSRTSARASFPVRFGPGAPSVRWVVDQRVYGGTWVRWVNGVAGTVRTFGAASSAGVARTTSTPGRTYQFRTRAVDAYGNSTTTVTGGRAVVPFDHSKATMTGGTVTSSSRAWLGTYRKLTRTSHSARVSLTGNRLQVIGWKCRACGSFALYDGSTRIATVSTYASSTVARTVLFTKTYTRNAAHTFTIRPLGTSGRPAVILDGFAMRR